MIYAGRPKAASHAVALAFILEKADQERIYAIVSATSYFAIERPPPVRGLAIFCKLCRAKRREISGRRSYLDLSDTEDRLRSKFSICYPYNHPERAKKSQSN